MNAKTIEEYYAMDPDKPFDAQAWASDRKNYATVNSCDLQNRFMPTAPPQTATQEGNEFKKDLIELIDAIKQEIEPGMVDPLDSDWAQARARAQAQAQIPPPQTVTQAQAEANVFVKTHLEMNKLLERKNTLTQSIVKFREPSEYNASFEDTHEITQLAYDNITTNWYLGTEPISYTGGRPQQIIRK